jgi:DNA polymerase-1
VYRNDCKLIPVVADMEWVGIKINRPYVQEAYHYEMDLKAQAEAEFEALSGHPLVDSGKSLAEAFTAVGEEYPLTNRGNPSFAAEVLEGFKTPLARVLLKYRSALKLAGTYYANFLTMADSEDLIHANLRLAGTATGRLSCASPNLQNLAKEENTEQKYTVRRSFVPRPDYCFVMIDYQAAEYRLLLDLCGQTDVSHQVLAGLDVHAATAKMMGVTRSEAKTLNFMLLYGGGVGKLALSLGIPLGRAKELKNTYFDAMPEVTKWTRELVKWAEQNKHFSNLYGFIYQFPNSDHCYAAPNHMIQGCCAQIIRFAMVELHKRLQSMKSRMLLSVHDEVIFEVHKSELHIVDDLKAIMEQSYTPRLLPQACEVTHSWVSWADKTKGNPT